MTDRHLTVIQNSIQYKPTSNNSIYNKILQRLTATFYNIT